MGRHRSRVRMWAVMLAAAACGGNDVTAPTLAACHSGVQPLVLSVGTNAAMDPLASLGCIIIPANASTTDSAEYLLIPQASTTGADFRSSFRLAGGAPITAAPAVGAQFELPPASPAQQFHDALRLMEQNRSFPLPSGPPPVHPGLAAPTVPRAPPVGDRRTFKVISSITGIPSPVLVGAIARSVGVHVAIYVDSTAPANGLVTADFDAMPVRSMG